MIIFKSIISLGPTQTLVLPPLLRLGRIHRILRMYFVSEHGLLHRHHCRAAPALNDPSGWCAKRCVAGAAALLRLHLCISASAARVADGAASPGLHIGKCSLGALLIGSDASSVSPSSPASSNPAGAGSGAERSGEGRTARTRGWRRKKRCAQRGREREKAVLLVFGPHPFLTAALRTSLLSPPSKRNRLLRPLLLPSPSLHGPTSVGNAD